MKGSYLAVFILLSLGCLSLSHAAIFGLGKRRGDIDVRLYNRYPRPNPARFRGLGAEEPAGIVVTVRGSSWRIPKNEEPLPLFLRSTVYMPDRLKTDRNASLKVALVDNSVLSMTGESEVLLEEYIFTDSEKRAHLSFDKGILGFLIGDMALYAPENVVIESGIATIGIRGSGGFLRWLDRAIPTLEIATMEGHVLDVRLPGGQHLVVDQAPQGLRVDALGNVEVIPIPIGYFSFEGFDDFIGLVAPPTQLYGWSPVSPPPLRQQWPQPVHGFFWQNPLAKPRRRRLRKEVEDLAQTCLGRADSVSDPRAFQEHHQFRICSIHEKERPSPRPLLERLAREQGFPKRGKGLRPNDVRKESASSILVLKALGRRFKESASQRPSHQQAVSEQKDI